MKIDWKKLIISILIPLILGGLSGFITRGSMDMFNSVVKPPFSPPGIVFPIVWTILYFLMGISFYLIWISSSGKIFSIMIYSIQLIVNIIWPLLFFNLKLFLFSFIWLILLWLLISIMLIAFTKNSKIAAYLQIPYLIWVAFAGYLNYMIYILN